MHTIDEASEWEEDHSRYTINVPKEVYNIKIGEKEYTFDPKERIFGAKEAVSDEK